MFPQINSYYSVSYNQVNKVWGEEGSPFNMDITTGHVILNYMEDHLHDAERLNKEWEALCAYKADDRWVHHMALPNETKVPCSVLRRTVAYSTTFNIDWNTSFGNMAPMGVHAILLENHMILSVKKLKYCRKTKKKLKWGKICLKQPWLNQSVSDQIRLSLTKSNRNDQK